MSTVRDLEKAHELFKAGDLAGAEQICASVLEADPSIAKAWQLRCLIAKKAGNFPAAEQFIRQALVLSPEDAECLNTLGNLLKMTGRFSEAAEAYEASLKQVPNYATAAQNLGELYLMQKDPLRAADVFRSALTHLPGHPGLSLGLLYALKDSQQRDAAQALLTELPQAPETALPAGQILAESGQYFQAKSAFAAALSHPPSAGMAFRNLIQIVRMQDGAEAAEKSVMQMIEDNPQAGFLYMAGADLLRDMGDESGALDLLERTEKTFGPQIDIQAVRADIAVDYGDGDTAFVLAESALAQAPGHPSLMSSYARGALMTERFDKALEAARAAQNFMPDNQFWIAIEASALRGLGENYQRLFHYKDFVAPYNLETPPEYKDRDDFIAQLKSSLENRHINKFHPIGQSLRGGTQTSSDLRFAPDRVIQDFFQALSRPIGDYLSKIGRQADHPLTRRNSGDYRLTGAWSVKLSGDGFHVNHVHPEGWISSSFYVDVPTGTATDPDKKGWIKFGEPPFKVPGQEAEHFVCPAAGLLVLFPSYMWHGTVPIAPGESRMTLPFDAVPA